MPAPPPRWLQRGGDDPGMAAADVQDRRTDRAGDGFVEPAGDHAIEPARVEGTQLEHAAAVRGVQLEQEIAERGGHASRRRERMGHEEQNAGGRVPPPRNGAQHVERVPVAPLQIVDDEDHRRLAGQLAEDPADVADRAGHGPRRLAASGQASRQGARMTGQDGVEPLRVARAQLQQHFVQHAVGFGRARGLEALRVGDERRRRPRRAARNVSHRLVRPEPRSPEMKTTCGVPWPAAAK